MSIDRWMDKEVVIYIHNGILLSHKRNTFESVLMRWMNLEPIIQSEVSQEKKQILSINIYIWKLERWWWWTYLQNRKRVGHDWATELSWADLIPIFSPFRTSLPTLSFSLSQSPCFEFPESYSKLSLSIYFTYSIVNFHVTFSIHLPFSFLPFPHIHRSVLYVSFSIAALKINSSVTSF